MMRLASCLPISPCSSEIAYWPNWASFNRVTRLPAGPSGACKPNTLTAADARSVEAAFRTKLAALGDEPIPQLSEAAQKLAERQLTRSTLETPKPAALSEESGTRRGRVRAKTIRLRDKDHRRYVSTQPCLVCGRSPADAHHLLFAQPRALGCKVSEEFTVPLCRVHHRELHRHGAEAAWWRSIKIDPLPVANRLWQHTQLNATTGEGAVPAFDHMMPECRDR
jgi:hypothetical protein